ncbi:MFS transporter [Paenibacillus sp. PK3_47]|uniref:MFS transporter n=1 Tax=Paenibacillus sp. PK3_47 TaxID=2072642 RepID=UPI00201E626E|nr:MFS transporter [Paenibacillus sp. PK3_47]UQZ36127.1 MFS transporter [Paenibacillus sp. PK3_47]
MNANKLIAAGLPMIAVTYGLSRFSYGLLLPHISESVHMDQSTSGLISSLSYIAYCISIAAVMAFSAKFSPRSILLAAGLLSVVGLGIISVSPDPFILGLGIFVAGLSTGLASPPYADIVSTNIEEKRQNQTNSWINSGTSIGTVLTGCIAIVMAERWRESYWIFIGMAIVTLFVNYKVLPKQQAPNKKEIHAPSKEEWMRSIRLMIASLLLGLSCTPYWTFSRDYMLTLDSVPAYLGEWFWVIIGLAGLLGGTAGVFINKFGLLKAYWLSVAALSTSSLILGMNPGSIIIGFLSPVLFGSSYIFVTGAIIVWGISLFKTNPSFGIAVPFLLLALGQATGSIFAGQIADSAGYNTLFIGAAVMGFVALVFWPKIKENSNG